MGVIPRPSGKTYDCTDCEWQGKLFQTDSGSCPDCGADIQLVEDDHDYLETPSIDACD